MIAFEKLKGPYGIPVYFQKLGRDINPISLRLTVFTGSADDLSIEGGRPGLFHWFEHVPFVGTQKYRGGYQGVDGPFTRHGASLNAETDEMHTSFHISAPKRLWKESVDILSQLVMFPLLTKGAIDSERSIIAKELISELSEAAGYADHFLNSILFKDHPVGHPVLGSSNDLLDMDEKVVRRAHKMAYSLSRMAFFAAGDLPRHELMMELEKALKGAPDNKLSERRASASYGPLPVWKGGEKIVRKAPFRSSTVFLLFPLPPQKDYDFVRNFMGEQMISAGDMASPLYRHLREKKQLVYDIDTVYTLYPDGGYWGFSAECESKDSDKVVRALWELLRSREIRTAERLRIVKDSIAARLEMRLPDPAALTEEADDRLVRLGRVIRDEEAIPQIKHWTKDKVLGVLDTLEPKNARTVIFQGKG